MDGGEAELSGNPGVPQWGWRCSARPLVLLRESGSENDDMEESAELGSRTPRSANGMDDQGADVTAARYGDRSPFNTDGPTGHVSTGGQSG